MSTTRPPLLSLLLPVLFTLGACSATRPVEPHAMHDDTTFEQRAAFILRQTAARDTDDMIAWFDTVDYFQGAGGDRHKYILPPILAKLHADPADEQGLRAYRMLMEVDKQKGDRGLYHFAAFQRARLYGQLRDRLPRDVVESMEYDVRHFAKIMDRGGTENHAFMHRCSGYILAELIDGPWEGVDRDAYLAKQKAWLIDQAKRYYHVGTGEYDSSTYLGFSAASWANVYDFTSDPQMKLVAKAALDWLAIAMAQKYFHGLNAGPEARGFATEPVGHVDDKPRDRGTDTMTHAQEGAHSDWVAWLWFGNSAGRVLMDRTDVEVNRFPVQVLAMSSYRPHPLIRELALKRSLELPYEVRASKPQYYSSFNTGTNKDQEYLYVAEHFMMGTLYSPEDGVATTGTILPQTSMFKAALLDADNHAVRVFGMANGYHRHFPLEGRTPYDQYHQHKGAAILVTHVDKPIDERTKHRSILGIPPGVAAPVQRDGWYFWQVGQAYLAAQPLTDNATFITLEERYERTGYDWLVADGSLTGWVVQAADHRTHATFDSFINAVLRRCKLDLSAFDTERTATFHSLEGHTLTLRHTGGPGGRPDAATDGKPIDYTAFPVYDSPWLKQPANSGILTLTNGRDTLTIDFREDTPVYQSAVAP